jgi:hypothetical protein
MCNGVFAQDKPPPEKKPQVASQDEATPQSLASFRRSLIRAAEEAHDAGEITRGELFKIRISSISRPALRQMQQAVAEQAVHEGKIVAGSPMSAVNWDNLLQFIKELLPVILEIIKLFS